MIRVDLDVEVEPVVFQKVFKTPPGDVQAIRDAVKKDIVESLQFQYQPEENFIRVIGHRRNRRGGRGRAR